MQLGRIAQSTSFTLATQSTTPAPVTNPVVSVNAAALQVNLGLALPAIPRPVPSPNPAVSLQGPLQFQPGKITAFRNIAVVGSLSPGMKVGDAITEADLLNRAQKAGLNSDELSRLKQILDNSPDFKADASLLKEILPDNVDDPYMANPNRALRTFMDLDELRRAHPDRITPDVVSSLVVGVAQSKSAFRTDEAEGVLGENAADRAAQALIAMPQGDYNAIQDTLKQAGHGGTVDSDAQTERALILKAVSARADQYEHPTINDSMVRPETLEIETFANTIRGKDRDSLIARTTVTAGDDVLEQRYADSCVPATVEMAKAEADPIYAWKLHNEEVSSRDMSGFIGTEQAQLMKEDNGMIVTFQTLQQLQEISGSGNPLLGAVAKSFSDALSKQGSSLEDLANVFVSDTTGRDYHSTTVNNDNYSRTMAADYMEKLVRQGVDVPIRVNWTKQTMPWPGPLKTEDTGVSHALLVTDVRGSGDNTVFVIADAGSGSTYEVKRSDLISGNTSFGGAQGRLSEFLW